MLITSVQRSRNGFQGIVDCKAFVLKKLTELGTKQTEIEFLEREIDFDKYLSKTYMESVID